MAKVVSFSNQKGGVGKTTSCVNIAAQIANKGKKVLMIDMDPQGNATSGLGLPKSKIKNTIYDVIIGRVGINEAIIKTKFKNLSGVYFKNCVFKTDDLSVLSTYDLYNLEISDCGLTDARLASINFEAFERLSSLCLNGNNNLTDLSATAHTTDTLETLQINNIAVENPDWLKNFTKLTELYIDNTGISDLNCLTEMAYLEVISANGNNITSLYGLKNTTILNLKILTTVLQLSRGISRA